MSKKLNIDKWEPTEKQRKFVDGLISGLNITDAATQAAANRNTWYTSWQYSKDFREYIERRRAGEALSQLPAIDRAIFKKAREGDIPAAKLVYEVFGQLRVKSLQLFNQVNQVNMDISEMTLAELKLEARRVAEELASIANPDKVGIRDASFTSVPTTKLVALTS